jgi:hypothetical protein
MRLESYEEIFEMPAENRIPWVPESRRKPEPWKVVLARCQAINGDVVSRLAYWTGQKWRIVAGKKAFAEFRVILWTYEAYSESS